MPAMMVFNLLAACRLFILFIYSFKNSTQYKQYKIEDTVKAVEF